MIFLSLKTYKQASGDAVIKLLLIAKQVAEETGVPIIPCAQATDIYRIKRELGIEVWAQHVDPIDPGQHFGWISPYSVKLAGASGAVINHSERPLESETIQVAVKKAHEYGLKIMVVCPTAEFAQEAASWRPDYIAYERADLIAGQKAMIDEEEVKIKQLAQNITIPLIVGAGVTTGKQANKAVKIGAKGIFIASAVIKAADPEAKLRELANGFK